MSGSDSVCSEHALAGCTVCARDRAHRDSLCLMHARPNCVLCEAAIEAVYADRRAERVRRSVDEVVQRLVNAGRE